MYKAYGERIDVVVVTAVVVRTHESKPEDPKLKKYAIWIWMWFKEEQCGWEWFEQRFDSDGWVSRGCLFRRKMEQKRKPKKGIVFARDKGNGNRLFEWNDISGQILGYF